MNIEKHLIDYSKLNVGDKLWSIQLGDCTMRGIGLNAQLGRMIVCDNAEGLEVCYTEEGFHSKKDAFPSLFTSNPFAEEGEQITLTGPFSVYFDKFRPDTEYIDENPESILQEAERIVSGDRDKDYGSVKENFGKIAQMWSAITGASITERQVGWMMIALKAARDTHKEKRDNLVDAVGYVLCMEKMEKEGAK